MSANNEGISSIASHLKISEAEAAEYFRLVRKCFRGYEFNEHYPDTMGVYYAIKYYTRRLEPH